MQLENLLVRNKRAILEDWFHLLAGTYPADTAQFLERESNSFANPVGGSMQTGMDAIFDSILKDMDRQAMIDILDPLIRIRAVQSFSPSNAVGFIFLLKTSIRKVLNKDIFSQELFDEFSAFQAKIDELALIGFDIYMECREKIYQLKEKEVKNRALLAFSQEGLIGNRPG